MAAPERFAKRQIPLAPRAPSIHGPFRQILRRKQMSAFKSRHAEESQNPTYLTHMRNEPALESGCKKAVQPLPERRSEPVRCHVRALGKAMRPRSRAGGKPAKVRRRKRVAQKRRNAPRTVRRGNPSAAAQKTRIERLNHELNDALERQSATAEILASISGSSTDPRPVFDAILRNLLRLFDTRFAIVALVRDDILELVGIKGETGFEKMAEGYPRPLDDRTLAGKAILAGRAMQLVPVGGNPEAPPSTERWGREFGFNALISVPLVLKGKVIGGISTARRDPIQFTDKQVALIELFADQAVIAIENTRLLNELRELLARQTATSEVLQVISSSTFDLDRVFNTLLEAAMRLCESKITAIWLRDGDCLKLATCRGCPSNSRNSPGKIRSGWTVRQLAAAPH